MLYTELTDKCSYC